MSARRPIVFWPGRVPLRVPTTPVVASPRWISMPQRGELVGDDLRGARLLEGGLGMAMDVAADGGQLGRQAGETVRGDMGHGGRLAAAAEPCHKTATFGVWRVS